MLGSSTRSYCSASTQGRPKAKLILLESDCAKFQGSWDPELALGASLGCHKRRGSLLQIILSLKRYAGEAIGLKTHALSKLRALTVLFKNGGGAGFIDELSPVLRVLAIPSCDDFAGGQGAPPLSQKRNHAALCQAGLMIRLGLGRGTRQAARVIDLS